MAEETGIVREAVNFGKMLFSDAIVHGTVESLKKAAEEETRSTLRRLKVKLFGWGDNDERISLGDQANLGQAAVQELNKYLEGLDDRWTYRFRIIISGIEDQAQRLAIYRMILDLPKDERKRQLEQVCQTPEYLAKAAKWIWRCLKSGLSDKELRKDVEEITSAIDRKTKNRKGTTMKFLRQTVTDVAQAVDAAAGRGAKAIRHYRRESAERKKQPLRWWIIPRILFGYDRRLSPKWRNR